MLNHITIMGRLCAIPELRTTQSGVSVTSFRIAVERNYTNQDNEREVDFFDVSAWRGTAEIVCKYFTKGRMIAIDGRLETQTWTDRDGNKRVTVGIVAESVYFADSKREEADTKAPKQEDDKPAKAPKQEADTGAKASKGKGRGRRAA